MKVYTAIPEGRVNFIIVKLFGYKILNYKIVIIKYWIIFLYINLLKY